MAELLQVIRADAHRGKGTYDDPHRLVTQYWTTDGQLLVERDPTRVVDNCPKCSTYSSFDARGDADKPYGEQGQSCVRCLQDELGRTRASIADTEKRHRDAVRKIEHDRDTLLTAAQKDADEITRLKDEVSKCGHTIKAQQDERAKLRAIIERLEAMQRVGTIAARELTENQRRRVRRQLRKVKSTVTLSDML